MLQLNTKPSDRQLRQFAGMVLPLAALIIAALLWLKFDQPTAALVFIGVTVPLCIAGYFRPALVRPVYVAWMVAAYPIGWVISHLVIGVIFFLVVTPIGLVMRLVGRDPLNRKFDLESETYWKPRKSSDDPARYFRQF